MFYLEHFFRLLISSPLKGIILGFLQLVFVVMLVNQDYIEKHLQSSLQKSKPRHFYALFSRQEKARSLERRLLKLPGISTVKYTEESLGARELAQLPEDLQSLITQDVSDLKSYSLKIALEGHVDKKSEELLRGFISAFDTSSFLGLTETTKAIMLKQSVFEKYIFYELMVVLLIIWGLLFMANTPGWKNYFYILSRSSRAKLAGVKTVATGFALLWFAGMAIGAAVPDSNIKQGIFFIPILAMAVSFFYRNSFNRGVK